MPARVIDLAAIAPDARAHLLGGLPHAFAAKRARAKGLGLGITLVIALGIALWFHGNFVRHEGTKLYSPTTFVIFALFAWVAAVPFVAYARMLRSLRRAPLQGTFLIGANLIVATERSLAIYPFAQCTAVGRIATAVSLTCFGRTFAFDFPDGRAFNVEQQIKNNANALVHAQFYSDAQTAMALDPFSQIAPHAAPRGTRSSWLFALPALVLALPVTYLIERSIDDGWYRELYGEYGNDRYLRSNGRHADELREKLCAAQMAAAETPPLIHVAIEACPALAATGNEKLDNLYTKTRAQLESMPPKAQPVLLELLDASRKGAVYAKLVVHGPVHADLAKIDALLDKAKLADIVRLTASFDPAALEHRETQLRDAIITAINGLGPSETFHVVQDPEKPAGLTIDMTYSLLPLVKGNDVIVYRETDPASMGRRFLGLTLHIELALTTAKGAKYAIQLDAEPPATISNEQYASSKAIYNNLVDAALADVTTKIAKMFKP